MKEQLQALAEEKRELTQRLSQNVEQGALIEQLQAELQKVLFFFEKGRKTRDRGREVEQKESVCLYVCGCG